MGVSNGSNKKRKVEPLKNSNGSPEDYQEKAQKKLGPKSLNRVQMKIAAFQMENCVCKIKLDDGTIGTGFFCLVPFPNKFNPLPVLITCNHVLNEQNILEGSKINFSLNDEKIKKSITINNSRITFTDDKKDITFIEIMPEDGIKDKSLLPIDENFLEDDFKQIYENCDVFMIHYEKGEVVKHSLGEIKYINDDNYTINHTCNTETGSSGGPIIHLFNFNVMGVHKGFNKTFKLGIGTLLKIPIEDFYKLNKDKKKQKEKNISKSTIEENINPRSNPTNGKISVILEDENQNDYSFICFKTDIFSSLQEKLFQKEPSLRNQKLCYIINNKKIDISKTIEENDINDGSIISYKIDKDDTNIDNILFNKKDTETKIRKEKISVIITDDNQSDYSFICFKNDIFSSLEKKLFEKNPSLSNKKHYYIINNQKIDISKTIEENNIVDGSNIYYKIEEDVIKPETQFPSSYNFSSFPQMGVTGYSSTSNESEVNIKKENNIIKDKISVIIEDENQNAYSLICRKTDKFSSLEKKLFKKAPSLKDQSHYYTFNNNRVYFSKTLEENNIGDGDTIYYKIDDEDIDNEFMAVIIKSTEQDINLPIACKKTDKFQVLEEKIYEKKPYLKNADHFYLYGGFQIDVEKTLEQLNIQDCSKIIINYDQTTIVN